MSHQQLQNGGHLFSCDGCPLGGEEFDKLDFREAIGTLNKNGWVTRESDREWQHFCKDCVDAGKVNEKIIEEEKRKRQQGSTKRR